MHSLSQKKKTANRAVTIHDDYFYIKMPWICDYVRALSYF